MWKGYIEHNNPILPDNFEFHCAELLSLRDRMSFDNCRCPLWLKFDLMQLLAIFPNFCIDRPFGFSIYRDDYFVFVVSNFCLGRPFGFSTHRDAPFCLSRPFGFSTYRAVLLFFRRSIS